MDTGVDADMEEPISPRANVKIDADSSQRDQDNAFMAHDDYKLVASAVRVLENQREQCNAHLEQLTRLKIAALDDPTLFVASLLNKVRLCWSFGQFGDRIPQTTASLTRILTNQWPPIRKLLPHQNHLKSSGYRQPPLQSIMFAMKLLLRKSFRHQCQILRYYLALMVSCPEATL